jgi:hypothetical protein
MLNFLSAIVAVLVLPLEDSVDNKELKLTAQEKKELVAFMRAL